MKIALTALTLAWSVAAARAVQPPIVTGGVSVEQTEAVVKAVKVDVAGRKLTIQAPDGHDLTIDVPRSVPNLDKIKPGTPIDVSYLESAAITIARPGETEPPSMETVRVTPVSGAASEAVSNVETISGMITDIDRSKRRLTIKAAGGTTETMSVPASVPNLDQVKIGDRVIVQYSSAVAIKAAPHGEAAPR